MMRRGASRPLIDTRGAIFHSGRHLAIDELVDARDRCLACGFAADRRAIHRIQSDPAIEMLECPRCRVVSASWMPTPATLDGFYGSYYDPSSEQVTFDGADRFARHLLRSCDLAARSSVTILDFGGGDGTLSRAIAERLSSAAVTVVDYGDPIPGGSFDLVIASAVLEHIPNLQLILAELLERVAPRGFFYARTPYVLPLRRLVRHLDVTFPAHVHDMGSGFWNRVVDRLGFDGRVLASRPSIVETELRRHPLRTLAAYALKGPANLEARLWPGRDPVWRLVGGWEVVLERTSRA